MRTKQTTTAGTAAANRELGQSKQKSRIEVRRRTKEELRYLPSEPYIAKGWNDWGNGIMEIWFSISTRTKRQAIDFAQNALRGNLNRGVATETIGFAQQEAAQ